MTSKRKPEGKRPGIGKSLRAIRNQKVQHEDLSWVRQWEIRQEAKRYGQEVNDHEPEY